MKYPIFALTIIAIAGLAACGGTDAKLSKTENSNSSRATTTATPSTDATPLSDAPPIASTHGAGAATTAAPSSTGSASSEQLSIDTAALDARIEKADAKAKSKNASEADKLAAAAAYIERANVYYSAGQPRLYKFALGDFRRALRYQPDNAEAQAKMEQITEIYNSMGRPVPDNGNEP